ncbi:MAG: tetratricopeptide repeat protein, partial [Bacteroidota bacterium]
MKNKFILIIIIGLATFYQSFGQAGGMSEEEIQFQDKFLEATQKKILGNISEAEKIFKSLLKKDPKNDVILYELARIYHKKDQIEKALNAIQEAIVINDQIVWYHNLNADILLEKGQYLNAAVSYEKLIKLQPRIESHYTNLAFCYLRANEPSKAIKALDLIEAKYGVTQDISRKKFEIYDSQGKESKAIEVIEDLIEAYPNEMEYRHILAVYYKKIGKEDKAKDVYTTILQMDPEDSKANIAMADEFRKGGQDHVYLNSIKSIISNPSIELDIKIQELIPYVEKLNNNKDQRLVDVLLDLSNELDKVHPEEAKVFSLQGDVLNAAEQKEAALKSYQKALNLDETVFSIWEQSFYLLADLKDMEGLIDLSEQAMDVFPNQALVYYMNGLGQSATK